MTNTREKLIELLGYETCKDKECIGCKHYSNETGCIDYLKAEIADHLIANGVTMESDCHWATEQAYKNGYEAGKKDATADNLSAMWIPVSERLPNKEEYTAKAEDGTEYYVRLLIAYKTDIVEYEIGYYDGYKWLTEMPIRIIKDVLAWMPFPNLPEPPKGD